MPNTQIAKGFELLNPGLLDKRQGPYPTTAIACQKIPNTTKLVDGFEVNYRDGITVLIGVKGLYVPYIWKGGYQDDNLSPFTPADAMEVLTGLNETKSGASRFKDFYTDALLSGKTITFKISDFTAGDQISAFLFRADGTYNRIGLATSAFQTLKLAENYVRFRLYNDTAARGFTGTLTISSSLKDLEITRLLSEQLGNFFWSDGKVTIPVSWTNSGAYWDTVGAKVLDVNYDISAPVPTSGYQYFGVYGKLNLGFTSIVSVNEQNKFSKVLEIGRLPYSNNGMSLLIFKTTESYFSISSDKNFKDSVSVFQLKSPFLIKVLDEIEANKTSIASLADSITTDVNYSGTANISVNRQLEIPSPLLRKGRTIEYKMSGSTGSIDVYLFRADDTYIKLPEKAKTTNVRFKLEDNFVKVRFYNTSDTNGYTGYVTVLGILNTSAADLENTRVLSEQLGNFFWSDGKVTLPVAWTNSGAYWNTAGAKVLDVNYDISAPVPTAGYQYFGVYGKLNLGFTSIVSVNDQNQFSRVLEVGRAPYNNNGMSLIIFKTTEAYFSISSDKNFKDVVSVFQLKSPFLIKILDELEANKNSIASLADSITSDVNYSGTANLSVNRQLELPSPLFKKGRTIEYKISGSTGSIDVYLFRADDTYIKLPEKAKTTNVRFKLDDNFVKVRFYNTSDTNGYTGYVTVLGILNTTAPVVNPIRTLILGDSYSAGNATPSNWVNAYNAAMPAGSTFYSLAVSSATVRDRSADRGLYPYTSRPVSTNNTGNLNTLACQVQKLKRLMDGTDLDAGEVKLYPTQDTYPQVIIIEGGMNDSFDSPAVEATYSSQYTKKVSGVYKKVAADASPTLGDVYTITPANEVDRTNFAGAYRYLVEELSTLFPNAQIFFTTASRLGYWDYDVAVRRDTAAAQQRRCAQLCGATVIDWNAEGQVNTIFNYPAGSGTQADPYIINKTALMRDSSDAMHPNSGGGLKYGRLAANIVTSKFLKLS